MPDIKPIRPNRRCEVLSAGQVSEIKAATLHVLEHVGVHFPSQRALSVFAEHGARVDWETEVVRLTPDLVVEAMSHAPRTYTLAGQIGWDRPAARRDGHLLWHRWLRDADPRFQTRDEERRSCKEDVAMMARVADYLSSVSFYWPMVSAQDYGRLAPLHELDASFNNTVKHVQTETVMGGEPARYAVRMAEVIAGDRERMRANPPMSVLICTIAPLGQDPEGIEAGMVYAEAGIPVGFMAMPNMGATAPAAPGGALVVGSAEVVSALVLMQLVAPGASVFYSLLGSVMDPRTADYIVSIPEKFLCNAAAVQIAHDWGVPILAGAFGMDGDQPGHVAHGPRSRLYGPDGAAGRRRYRYRRRHAARLQHCWPQSRSSMTTRSTTSTGSWPRVWTRGQMRWPWTSSQPWDPGVTTWPRSTAGSTCGISGSPSFHIRGRRWTAAACPRSGSEREWSLAGYWPSTNLSRWRLRSGLSCRPS